MPCCSNDIYFLLDCRLHLDLKFTLRKGLLLEFFPLIHEGFFYHHESIVLKTMIDENLRFLTHALLALGLIMKSEN